MINKNLNSLVLISAFNEEGRVSKVINECKKYFKYIVVVDDGSEDNTLEEIKGAQPNFILKHCANCGAGSAVRTGINFFLKKTQFDYLVTIDGDTQHKPINAREMLNFTIENNLDVVLGSRFLNTDDKYSIPFNRKILLKLAILFERLFYGINLSDSHNGMRVISRKACYELSNLESASFAYCTEIPIRFKKSKYTIKEFAIEVNYGINKKSQSIFSSLNIISDLIQKK